MAIQDSMNKMTTSLAGASYALKRLGAGKTDFSGEPQMNNLTAYDRANQNLEMELQAKKQQMLNSSLVSFYGGKD